MLWFEGEEIAHFSVVYGRIYQNKHKGLDYTCFE